MSEKSFKVTISSEKRLFDFHFREVWKYRDLIFTFVKKDFIARYKQTLLGPLWAIIKPIFTALVFMLVFGAIANLSATDVSGVIIPSFLFYYSGSICWGCFSSTVERTSKTFLTNARLMSKVYYPRIISPISEALSNLVSFGIQFAIFIVAWVVYLIIGGNSMMLSTSLLLLPLVLLGLIFLSMGLGLIISSLTTKYRDLQMIVGFGLQLLQYLSPVAYGLVLVSEIPSTLGVLYMLVPMTPLITTFRYALFGVGYFNVLYFCVSLAVSVFVLFVGVLLFNKTERNFTDTI